MRNAEGLKPGQKIKIIKDKWYEGSRTEPTNVSDAVFFLRSHNSDPILEFVARTHKWEKLRLLMLSKHAMIPDYSILNGKICFFIKYSFEHLNDFGDYFIKILEKLSTYLLVIINVYRHEKIGENRLIGKLCEVYYHPFSQKTVTLISYLTFLSSNL